MENIQWIFSGIGTEIFSLLIGVIIGGLVVYKAGIHNSAKQIQKAGNNASQIQEFNFQSGMSDGNVNNKVDQRQIAGDEAFQKQMGRNQNVNG